MQETCQQILQSVELLLQPQDFQFLTLEAVAMEQAETTFQILQVQWVHQVGKVVLVAVVELVTAVLRLIQTLVPVVVVLDQVHLVAVVAELARRVAGRHPVMVRHRDLARGSS